METPRAEQFAEIALSPCPLIEVTIIGPDESTAKDIILDSVVRTPGVLVLEGGTPAGYSPILHLVATTPDAQQVLVRLVQTATGLCICHVWENGLPVLTEESLEELSRILGQKDIQVSASPGPYGRLLRLKHYLRRSELALVQSLIVERVGRIDNLIVDRENVYRRVESLVGWAREWLGSDIRFDRKIIVAIIDLSIVIERYRGINYLHRRAMMLCARDRFLEILSECLERSRGG